jgi:hypothetical protein
MRGRGCVRHGMNVRGGRSPGRWRLTEHIVPNRERTHQPRKVYLKACAVTALADGEWYANSQRRQQPEHSFAL